MPDVRGWSKAAGLGVLLALASAAGSVEAQVLDGSAGLAGLTKAGRWTPVLIMLEGADRDLSGDLLVSWGPVSLRHAVTLPASGRRRVEVLARTSDVGSFVGVQFVVDGVELASSRLPVRAVPHHDEVTLCVAPAQVFAADTSRCTATLAADRLPQSLRGFDAVDRIELLGDVDLTREQRSAIDAWQAFRRLDASGDLAMTGGVARPTVRRGMPSPTAKTVALFAAGYAAALLGLGFALRARRVSLRTGSALTALVIVTAGAVTLVVGDIGPARAVRVHHQSLLQQLPGTGASLLTMRGVAEFPAHAAFAVRLPLRDGAIETPNDQGGSDQQFDEDGYPVLTGSFGMGARRAFTAEATVALQPLAVMHERGRTTVRNQSSQTLTDCRVAAGLVPGEPVSLAPGASIAIDMPADAIGPVLTCVFDGAPIHFEEPSRPVVSAGTTTIAVYRDGVPAGDDYGE